MLSYRLKSILNCTKPVPAALSRLAEITLQLRNMLLLGSVMISIALDRLLLPTHNDMGEKPAFLLQASICMLDEGAIIAALGAASNMHMLQLTILQLFNFCTGAQTQQRRASVKINHSCTEQQMVPAHSRTAQILLPGSAAPKVHSNGRVTHHLQVLSWVTLEVMIYPVCTTAAAARLPQLGHHIRPWPATWPVCFTMFNMLSLLHHVKEHFCNSCVQPRCTCHCCKVHHNVWQCICQCMGS
jgi:hypothetical protein